MAILNKDMFLRDLEKKKQTPPDWVVWVNTQKEKEIQELKEKCINDVINKVKVIEDYFPRITNILDTYRFCLEEYKKVNYKNPFSDYRWCSNMCVQQNGYGMIIEPNASYTIGTFRYTWDKKIIISSVTYCDVKFFGDKIFNHKTLSESFMVNSDDKKKNIGVGCFEFTGLTQHYNLHLTSIEINRYLDKVIELLNREIPRIEDWINNLKL